MLPALCEDEAGDVADAFVLWKDTAACADACGAHTCERGCTAAPPSDGKEEEADVASWFVLRCLDHRCSCALRRKALATVSTR
jgi:hypothetical protein